MRRRAAAPPPCAPRAHRGHTTESLFVQPPFLIFLFIFILEGSRIVDEIMAYSCIYYIVTRDVSQCTADVPSSSPHGLLNKRRIYIFRCCFIVLRLEAQPVRVLTGAEPERGLEVSAKDLLVLAFADRLDDGFVHGFLVSLALLGWNVFLQSN